MATFEDSDTVLLRHMSDAAFWGKRLEESVDEWNYLFGSWLYCGDDREAAILAKRIAKCEERIKSIESRLKSMLPK
jgi:hypothetical protein